MQITIQECRQVCPCRFLTTSKSFSSVDERRITHLARGHPCAVLPSFPVYKTYGAHNTKTINGFSTAGSSHKKNVISFAYRLPFRSVSLFLGRQTSFPCSASGRLSSSPNRDACKTVRVLAELGRRENNSSRGSEL